MGIKYNSEKRSFLFNFNHDGTEDIIALTGSGYQVEAFGKCFYYGYEFADSVESPVRAAFIQYAKFKDDLTNDPELSHFVQRAVDNLSSQINLYDYNLVVMPQSSSCLNRFMLRYIYRFAQPMLQTMELVKNLPENVSFDFDAYKKQHLDDVLGNGRPRYTKTQKEDACASINEMMDIIHRKDYFTIAKDVKKNRYRPYIQNFLRFNDEEDRALCSAIRKQNILIVDDVTTSGSTLNEILRALRVLNEDNQISIFSLIGRKDLMVEK